MKFRKKPVAVDAWLIDRQIASGIKSLGDFDREILPYGEYIVIKTLEGDMRGNIGDWIIQGVNGEIYPCRDDIFKQTYEPV